MTDLPSARPATVYLDAASGEPLHPAARETWLAAAEHAYADPRRLHGPGREARLLLDNAREVLAGLLEARPDEVVLARSGTDACRQGLQGLLLAHRRRHGRHAHLAVGAVEHSCVLGVAREHEDAGGALTVLPCDRLGRVDPYAVAGAGADVVAVQSANHEVGTAQPLDAIDAALPSGTARFTDACASAGRARPPRGWVSALSAHKWGGPAGVGVLVLPRGSRWRRPTPADDRADERWVGFEDVPGALASAAALQAVVAERDERDARHRSLVDLLRRRVAAEVADVEVVGDPEDRLPHLVTFSCLYAEGEALVRELGRHGFAVDSGSACTASTLEPSHVLAAMGALTHGNVRVSLSRGTTEEDVERFLTVLPGVVAGVRAEVGM